MGGRIGERLTRVVDSQNRCEPEEPRFTAQALAWRFPAARASSKASDKPASTSTRTSATCKAETPDTTPPHRACAGLHRGTSSADRGQGWEWGNGAERGAATSRSICGQSSQVTPPGLDGPSANQAGYLRTSTKYEVASSSLISGVGSGDARPMAAKQRQAGQDAVVGSLVHGDANAARTRRSRLP